jgi:hypothetical protein
MSRWIAHNGQLGAMDGLAMDSLGWIARHNGRLGNGRLGDGRLWLGDGHLWLGDKALDGLAIKRWTAFDG